MEIGLLVSLIVTLIAVLAVRIISSVNIIKNTNHLSKITTGLLILALVSTIMFFFFFFELL